MTTIQFDNTLRPAVPTAMHWARGYIAKPWSAGCEGPNCFDCWGLVRSVFRTQLGHELPVMRFDQPQTENVTRMRRSAEQMGWKQLDLKVDGPLREFDVVFMRNMYGRRHIGVVTTDGRRTGVLHADGHTRPDGEEVGHVAFQTLVELQNNGLHGFEFWRRVELHA